MISVLFFEGGKTKEKYLHPTEGDLLTKVSEEDRLGA